MAELVLWRLVLSKNHVMQLLFGLESSLYLAGMIP